MTKQNHKIVLLDTGKSELYLCANSLQFDKDYFQNKGENLQSKHIYILSNEEIKEGDWCINKNKDTLYQTNTKPGLENWNKVIATTNPELHKDRIAKISDTDIQWYISEYNKENKIEEVELELQSYKPWDSKKLNCDLSKPKLTKDGCVIICKEEKEHDCTKFAKINCKCPEGICNYKKDGFTREDMENAFGEGMLNGQYYQQNKSFKNFDQWFEQQKF